MSRDILTNKWVLGGIGFLIVLSVACVLWYQHDTAPHRKAAADAEELLRQSQIGKKVSDTDSVTEKTADVVSVESKTPTAEKSITDPHVTKKTEPTQAQNETEADEAADVPVSPFGFGPYPEVPEDYPYSVHWESNIGLRHGMEHELLTRVRIKLWTQGIDAAGVTYGRGGLIYPVIRGVVYVTRSGDRITGVVLSHPGDDLGVFDTFWDAETPEEVDAAIQREMEGFTIDDLPAGLTAVDYNTAGIDPYQFLDLPRR